VQRGVQGEMHGRASKAIALLAPEATEKGSRFSQRSYSTAEGGLLRDGVAAAAEATLHRGVEQSR